MHTGKVIKILRKNKKLTQDQLSEILGVKKSSIQKYESGAVNNLKMQTLRDLCEYFNVPPWIFVFPERIQDENFVEDFLELSDENFNLNLSYFYRINRSGRVKVLIYARDLIASGNYTTKNSR